jgi:hypothetical protein
MKELKNRICLAAGSTAVAVEGCLLTLCVCSNAAMSFEHMFLALGGLVAAIGSFALHTFLVVPGEKRGRPRRPCLWWALVPLVQMTLIVLTIQAGLSGTALRLRFALSEGAMTRYAGAVWAAPSQPKFPTQVGLFTIERVDRLPGGVVRLATMDCGFGDKAGFAYCPTDVTPQTGEDSYRHLDGHWYLWFQSW